MTLRVRVPSWARSRIATIATVASLLSAVLVGSSSAVGAGVAHAATYAVLPAHCGAVYVVRPGDTLALIAARSHTTWPALRTLNQIDDANRIWPGERVCLTLAGAPPTPPSMGRRVVHTPHVGVPPAPPMPVPFVTTGGGIPSNDYCQGVSRAAAFATSVSAWAVPAGCFAGIWRPNPYAPQYLVHGQVAGSPGWCNWWPEVLLQRQWTSQLHPTGLRPGVAVHFAGGDQGASWEGHWAFVEAIGPNGWLLISEANDHWRNAGFGLVNYRFVRLDQGLSFFGV